MSIKTHIFPQRESNISNSKCTLCPQEVASTLSSALGLLEAALNLANFDQLSHYLNAILRRIKVLLATCVTRFDWKCEIRPVEVLQEFPRVKRKGV